MTSSATKRLARGTGPTTTVNRSRLVLALREAEHAGRHRDAATLRMILVTDDMRRVVNGVGVVEIQVYEPKVQR